MTWVDPTDPAADLAALAGNGNTAAAMQLLQMAIVHADDPRSDPLLRWLGQCCKGWEAQKFSAKSSRAAFGIYDKPQKPVVDPDRVEAVAAYRRHQAKGLNQYDARAAAAVELRKSDRWIKQQLDSRTPDEDLAADFKNRRR